MIVIPDNDNAGRRHAKRICESLYGETASLKLIELYGLKEKEDVTDWIEKGHTPKELSELVIATEDYEPAQSVQRLDVIDGSKWLKKSIVEPNPVLDDVFDTGDKVTIIASSKQRKSFFVLQMALILANGGATTAGRFLNWVVSRPRIVLLVQFEIKEHHFHKRFRNMAFALGISAIENIHIINARGWSGDMEELKAEALRLKAEVIIFDPLYKLIEGDENSAKDIKPILKLFDQIAEETGAAVVFTHHDPKGTPGARDQRDRGAGSNVLSRDCDCCITLTEHEKDESVAVIATLLRNYAPQEPFTAEWLGGCFEKSQLPPVPKTMRHATGKVSSALPLKEFRVGALELLRYGPMPVSEFRDKLTQQLGLTQKRERALVDKLRNEGMIEMEPGSPKKSKQKMVYLVNSANKEAQELEEQD